jgi:16S rRNA G966 N2-methylase RsmD/phage pi2 protein 07
MAPDFNKDFYDFVANHAADDCNKLRLQYAGKKLSFELETALTQISCRQKAAKKLPSLCQNSRFIFPSTLLAEQSTAESISRFHTSLIEPNITMLDMTGGLGSDDFMFCEKAKHVTAVEIDSHSAETLRHNAEALGLTNIDIVNDDSISFLQRIGDESYWDIIFIDPARRDTKLNRVYALQDCSPNVIENFNLISKHTQTILIKASPMLDITSAVNSLPMIDAIWIVGLRGECKELLLRVNCKSAQPSTVVTAVNILTNGAHERFEYHLNTTMPQPDMATENDVQEGCYLYEPNACVMKTGVWGDLCQPYPLIRKLHPNTHLFVSRDRYDSFPGRCMRITKIVQTGQDKKSLKGLKANVCVRNYPLEANQLRKKLNITDGGNCFVFGCTGPTNRKMIILAESV